MLAQVLDTLAGLLPKPQAVVVLLFLLVTDETQQTKQTLKISRSTRMTKFSLIAPGNPNKHVQSKS